MCKSRGNNYLRVHVYLSICFSVLGVLRSTVAKKTDRSRRHVNYFKRRLDQRAERVGPQNQQRRNGYRVLGVHDNELETYVMINMDDT